MSIATLAPEAGEEIVQGMPLNHNNPMALVEYTTMMLANVETPEQLAYAIAELMQPQSMEFIDQHSQELYVTGLLWMNAVKHIIETHPVENFPYDVLALPLLFDRWGWHFEMDENWQDLYQKLERRFARLPVDVQRHVDFACMMFFMDASFSDDSAPFRNLANRLCDKLPHPAYSDAMLASGMILGQNGWNVRF